MRTLRRVLEASPSLEVRVAAAARIVLIVAQGTEAGEVFGRKADAVLHYDGGVLLDDSGREFTEQAAKSFADEGVCIIRHLQARAITKKLRQCGIFAVMDLTHLDWRDAKLLDVRLIHDHLDKIEQVFARLDAQSAEILLYIILFRITADPDILKFSDYPQYIHKNLPFSEHEIIIDGGAFIGDSAVLFYNETQGRARIFSFEPDIDNYNTLFRNILHNNVSDRIHAIPYGIWDSRTTLFFNSMSQSSRIVESGDNFIKTMDIDWFCSFLHINPTWIKLDVEGAEMRALRGARDAIRSNKPKLCISLYHRAEDLWELPAFILSLRDDYVFHIGHHSPDLTIYETVLYAY